MAKVYKWRCERCEALGAHIGGLCNRCLQREHRDRWMLLPTPTQAEIDDAGAWLDAMQDEHDPVVPGFFVEDAEGMDQTEEFCRGHADALAATLGDGAYIGSCNGETDSERWCGHQGCDKQLDVGSFTDEGERSVLGLTEDDPMRAGTGLYGLSRIAWSMTPSNPRAALWMWHVDNHRSDMGEAIAAACHPHRSEP